MLDLMYILHHSVHFHFLNCKIESDFKPDHDFQNIGLYLVQDLGRLILP